MNPAFFYKTMAGLYDLVLEGIYFWNYEKSPRKVVLESIDEQDTVLDLCTGTAINAIRISQVFPKTKVVGIDISKHMLRQAKEKIQKKHIQNIKLYEMDATNMKFKDKSFDKVLISLVLHEMEESLAKKILKEAMRVLKNGGKIIVTEWEPSNVFWRKVLFFPVRILEPRSYRSFVKKDLSVYFENFGLEIEEEIHCDYSKVLLLKQKVEKNVSYKQ